MKNNNYISRGFRDKPESTDTCQKKVHAHSCTKLNVFNWIGNIKPPKIYPGNELAEVRFKNSRKDFFMVPDDLQLEEGDIVAVEASPGHDIGIVTLTGELVDLQIKKKKIDKQKTEFKKVYRKAKLSDIEKYVNAVDLEHKTMHGSRTAASDLHLQMKISDVEYQGDKTKAIFYYTADERVDFRQLIKVLAEMFNVRIEMRQIGMRQEASRLGGIGSCGRELCCSTWLTNFQSVSTNAARTQQLSLNPQKLAGQCSKLKCCINYENDCYLDTLKDQPDTNVLLKTKKGSARFMKSDILRNLMWYTYLDAPNNFICLTNQRVKEIMEMNQKNILPEDLKDENAFENNKADETFKNDTGYEEDSLTRFDKAPKNQNKRKTKRKKSRRKRPDKRN
ncbi:MAG: stage 0 sporulation family protein [Bacteroidales bacterium]